MAIPEWVKPAAWGVLGGAIAAVVLGFAGGGWITGETAREMEAASAGSAEAAIVQAFTPLCVAKAEQEPERLVALKEENSYNRDDFVIEAGWVDNVSEKYRNAVASACALTVVEGMKTD